MRELEYKWTSKSRTKRSALVVSLFAILALLAGCIELVSVSQPTKVLSGETFMVTANIYTSDDPDSAGTTRFGAALLPLGFTVNEASFCGSHPLVEDSALEVQLSSDFPPDPGYAWWVGSTGHDFTEGYCEATLSITAGPASGNFYIDYRVGFNDTYEDRSLNNLLEVRLDSDGDRVPDYYENNHGCLMANTADGDADPDGDNLTNLEEYAALTWPCDPDTDGDNLLDDFEVLNGCQDPFSGDSLADYDGDGLPPIYEQAIGTNSCLADTDGDGMDDDYESNYVCADAAVADGDQDPDGDGLMNLAEFGLSSNPCDPDTDSDGMPDSWEGLYADCGLALYQDDSIKNADGDLYLNHEEYALGQDPCVFDIDHATRSERDTAAGPNYYNFPLATEFEAARSQVIYPVSELGNAGTLTGIGLDVVALPTTPMKDFTIRIMHTELSEFSSASPIGPEAGWTVVHGGLLDVNATGWRTIDFEYPFLYNGEDNIVVDFSFMNDAAGESGRTRYTLSANYRVVNFAGDSLDDDPKLWEGNTAGNANLSMKVPNLRLYFSQDPDHDGDGLTHAYESLATLTDPYKWDTDGDGMNDGWEHEHETCGVNPLAADARVDQDNDGLSALGEHNLSTDPCDWDTDNDTMEDGWEANYVQCGVDPLAYDAYTDVEGDGVLQKEEHFFGTDACLPDTDFDGMDDRWELDNVCLDPLAADRGTDLDGDTLTNIEEYNIGSSPCLADTDGDGLGDYHEAAVSHTDPAKYDTDGEGLSDGDELLTFNTDPFDPDTDGDGMDDFYEVDGGCLDPLAADSTGDPDLDGLTSGYEHGHTLKACEADTDEDGMHDGWELDNELDPRKDDASKDPDYDGLSNLGEFLAGTRILDPDTDDDGMKDGYEARSGCLDPLSPDPGGDNDGDGIANIDEYNMGSDACAIDSDGDGMPDDWELANSLSPTSDDSAQDADGDGLANIGEYLNDTDPRNPDSDGDSMPDGYENDRHCLDPYLNQESGDPDGDQLPNGDEYASGAEPCDPDTDDDGLTDYLEVESYGSDPALADTDGDELSDAFEAGVIVGAGPDMALGTEAGGGDVESHMAVWLGADMWPQTAAAAGDTQIIPEHPGQPRLFLTDPAMADTDGDGIDDRIELDWGADPLDPGLVPTAAMDIGPGSTVWGSYSGPSSLAWTGSEYGMALSTAFLRVAADGDTLGLPVELGQDFQSARLAWTGSEFAAVWYSGDHQRVHFRRLSAEGALIGSTAEVSPYPSNIQPPSFAWTGSEFGVAFSRDHVGNDEIFFVRVSAEGTVSPEVRVTSTPYSSEKPYLAWDGQSYGMAWTEAGIIVFAKLGLNGAYESQPVLLSGLTQNHGPTLAWTGSEFAAAWAGYEQASDTEQVFFTKVSGSGAPIGQRKIVSDIEVACSCIETALVWNGSRFGISWVDMREGNFELFFQTLSPTGKEVGPNLKITDNTSVTYGAGMAWNGREFGMVYTDLRSRERLPYFTRISADSDGDNIGDHVEIEACSDHLNHDSDFDGLGDASEDLDRDGLHDDGETGACQNDTDGDGLGDGAEILTHGTDPLDIDTDGDGLRDGEEVSDCGTCPNSWDTDGDCVSDLAELNAGLNPLDSLDGETDYDRDGNNNAHEAWNLSDPFNADNFPPATSNPACHFWGDADGDGIAGPGDMAKIELEIAGSSQRYDNVIPAGIDTVDLDRDGTIGPGDRALLAEMIAGNDRASGYPSTPRAISVIEAPSALSLGEAARITVSVESASGAFPHSPGFAVVFWIDRGLSTGDARLLGGDGAAMGEAGGNRYDISGPAEQGALSSIGLLANQPGEVVIRAKVPACGSEPAGRWCDEVEAPPITIVIE